MAEKEQASAAGKYYRCTGGLTVGMTVAQEGEILEGDAFGEGFVPLSEQDQRKKFGRVLYTEVSPDDEMLTAIHEESVRVRAMGGMQHPDMPPVVTSGVAPTEDLATMSRQELRNKAKALGLNFPVDTDREKMIGAIEKKQTSGEEDEEEEEVVSTRRARAKKVIEESRPGTGSPTGVEEEEEE